MTISFHFVLLSETFNMRLALTLGVLCAALVATWCQVDELPMYKECLMECFRCVKTYGKQVYNGKHCAENCAVTNGKSIDVKCDRPTKRTGSRTLPTAKCAQLCSMKCAPDFNQDLVDAHACIFTCIISNEETVIC